ncbi:MAG: cupin domain-containing protein [Solirubrobacteraceae bacterium]|nr:cupin domain-containing protein [Patulibacter sp.]
MRRVNIADPEFTYDPDDPEGFRAGTFRYGGKVGARNTGSTVYEIPPGQSICPYHYEVAEEEWLLVLIGRPTLRTPTGKEQLEPFDSVFFPPGPDGAHAVLNGTDEPVRVLMYSDSRPPAVCVYPDSDKIGVDTGQADSSGNFLRSSRVGYYEGEV